MKFLATRFLRFQTDESGATAIEYGLIAGAIFLVIITAGTTIGKNLSATFVKVNSGLN